MEDSQRRACFFPHWPAYLVSFLFAYIRFNHLLHHFTSFWCGLYFFFISVLPNEKMVSSFEIALVPEFHPTERRLSWPYNEIPYCYRTYARILEHPLSE